MTVTFSVLTKQLIIYTLYLFLISCISCYTVSSLVTGAVSGSTLYSLQVKHHDKLSYSWWNEWNTLCHNPELKIKVFVFYLLFSPSAKKHLGLKKLNSAIYHLKILSLLSFTAFWAIVFLLWSYSFSPVVREETSLRRFSPFWMSHEKRQSQGELQCLLGQGYGSRGVDSLSQGGQPQFTSPPGTASMLVSFLALFKNLQHYTEFAWVSWLSYKPLVSLDICAFLNSQCTWWAWCI